VTAQAQAASPGLSARRHLSQELAPTVLRVLELGSGLKPYQAQAGEEVVHLDRQSLPHVEQVWNLDQCPWPFPDSSFDRVLALDVLEHVSDVRRTIEEVWRISKSGARLTVRVPHWASFLAHQDPTHRATFNEHSFDYFGQGEYSFYSHARLKVLAVVSAERYPGLCRFLRGFWPRLERGLKKHLLDMVTTITFELEVVK
jgi:SAM-dependent methyltransferase